MWICLMSHLIPSWIWHILILMEVKLKGEFPGNIFQLPNVQELWLSYNESLTSSFPRYNWTSPFRVLCLSSTRFLIDIPYLTRNLKYLNHLDVSNCKLRGPFSALHGKVTQISTSLDLSPNSFGGQIPWDSLNLERLNFLDVSENNFKGHLPEICNNLAMKTFFFFNAILQYLIGLYSHFRWIWNRWTHLAT